MAVFAVLSACSADGNNNDATGDDGFVTIPTEELELPDDFAGVDRLELSANGTVKRLSGEALFQPHAGRPEFVTLLSSGEFGEYALALLGVYRKPLGIANPNDELRIVSVREDELGYHQVRFTQIFDSLPIVDTEIVVHINSTDSVYLVQGNYIRTPSTAPRAPKLSISEIVSSLSEYGEISINDPSPELMLLPLAGGEVALVYRIEAKASLIDQSVLYVDSQTGSVLRKDDAVYSGRGGTR